MFGINRNLGSGRTLSQGLSIRQHQYCLILQRDKWNSFLPFQIVPNNFSESSAAAAVRLPTDQFEQETETLDPEGHDKLKGFGIALGAAVFSALYLVANRIVCDPEDKFVEPLVIAFYSGVIGLFCAILLGLSNFFDSE